MSLNTSICTQGNVRHYHTSIAALKKQIVALKG